MGMKKDTDPVCFSIHQGLWEPLSTYHDAESSTGKINKTKQIEQF